MKKIKESTIAVARIISFTIVFIFVLTYISYMSKPNSIDMKIISGLYGEKDNSIDVVYIGGSACFVYYEPLRAWQNYGIVEYNYGANTIMPEMYKNMIVEVLKTQKPKLIILDARAFQYREDELVPYNNPSEVAYRNVLTGMRFSMNKINLIKNNVGKYIEDDKLPYYFDIIKYHQTISYDEECKDMMFGKYQMPYRGFYFVLKHLEMQQEDYKTDEKEELPQDTNNILNELLDYIKTTNTNYLFVVSPYVEKKEHKKVYNTVEERVKESGYEFIDANDYTEEMNIDYRTDFYNDSHVNLFGADKYTDFLSEYILNRYNITNRKGDPDYEYINENLTRWNAETESVKERILKIIEDKKNDESGNDT